MGLSRCSTAQGTPCWVTAAGEEGAGGEGTVWGAVLVVERWTNMASISPLSPTSWLSPLPSHSLKNSKNKSSFVSLCVPSWFWGRTWTLTVRTPGMGQASPELKHNRVNPSCYWGATQSIFAFFFNMPVLKIPFIWNVKDFLLQERLWLRKICCISIIPQLQRPCKHLMYSKFTQPHRYIPGDLISPAIRVAQLCQIKS